MKILAFGEILWDVIEGVEYLGGAPFNVAAHAAQCGNKSYIVSRLGKDALGYRAYQLSKGYGVDASFIQWDEVYPTGIVDVTLTNGQPDYVIREHAAYDYIRHEDLPASLNETEFDFFYFGSLAQRSSVSSDTLDHIIHKNRFKHVFYDVNLRKDSYTEETIRKSLAVSSIFKLNIEEVPVISHLLAGKTLAWENFCESIKKLYPNLEIIIITAAERGCFLCDKESFTVPGNPVVVKDAVGAGDAFSASFLHSYSQTGDAFTAATIANQVGAFVATKAGAIPEYSGDILKLLNIT